MLICALPTPTAPISPAAPTVCSEVKSRAIAPITAKMRICGTVIQCQSSIGLCRVDSMYNASPVSPTPPASSQPSHCVVHHTVRPCTRKAYNSAMPEANRVKLSASVSVNDLRTVMPGGSGRANRQAVQASARVA